MQKLSLCSGVHVLGVFLMTGIWGPPLSAQEDLWSRGSVGTGLLLRRLDGVKRVLMIGAHPDDEDTALLAALARGMGVETAYLSLSRGEGGQNLLGPEMDEGLGVLRTGELLAARSRDGGRQFFTRAFDFGFSKSPEESFRYWPREELLRDVTWVVRTFRPQVIVTVFSGTPSDGHGHHQVAGILAREVFHAAGDAARFPEQISLGGAPWTPLKLYQLTRRNPQEGHTAVETGVFDPLLGGSWFQVAMDSRSQHRSQDMGVAQPLGPRRSTLALLESRVSGEGPDELFSGVDTTLLGLAAELPEPVGSGVRDRLSGYRDAIAEARESPDLVEPWWAAPALGRAVRALHSARDQVRLYRGGVRPAPGWGSELDAVLEERFSLVQVALLRAAGVVVDVRMEDELLVPGESVEGVIEVWNGGPFPLRGASGLLLAPDGWGVEALDPDPADPRGVPPGEVARWRFRVQVPDSVPPSGPYYLQEPREGELYRWPSEPSLWGEPGNPAPLRGRVTLEAGESGGVEIMKEAHYRGVDKATGEFVEPVLVVPALSVTLDPPSVVSPGGGEGGRWIYARIRSQTREGVEGRLRLELPAGWSSDPVEIPFRVAGAGADAAFEFHVFSPAGVPEGTYGVGAVARTVQGTEFREGLTLVDYPHVRRTALLSPARSNVSIVPVSLDPGLRVGYVMGSGDMGPEVLRQMGASVELLGPEAVRAGAYQGVDVVVLGIRAYETRPELAAANERLLEFARRGGTVVVQYNKYEFPQGGFAPFPVEMARPHDRVTDETAPVTILEPGHPLFQRPNLIGPGDFEGWVQERGLYFLSRWDPRFTPLLGMADAGEEQKRGGLVVARVGDGAYVYTGLAFFRQFPEGIAGAYRLFANLVSLKGEALRE